MRTWNLLRCLISLGTVSLLVLGCGGPKHPPADVQTSSTTRSSPAEWMLEPPVSVLAERDKSEAPNPGLVLYQHYCSVCHGPEGRGDGQYYSDSLSTKPMDLTDHQAVTALSDEHLTKVIREGSVAVGKSALCPPWGRVMNDEQVVSLVAHLRHLPTGATE